MTPPVARHRMGSDLTIERVAGGGVRLLKWSHGPDGSVSEVIQKWDADEWIETVLAVSAPGRLDGMNRSLVRLEIERIHVGRG